MIIADDIGSEVEEQLRLTHFIVLFVVGAFEVLVQRTQQRVGEEDAPVQGSDRSKQVAGSSAELLG
ncbi:hypothetical protein ACFY1L_52740 [Streptomyces sp. NPDC001663]|uniref:hypothetical protein n=1 Tax=Streptomyces sp. NPDC001663 TaxID=3364597 RepID=UPI003688BF77